jgi:hypothetical protein
MSGIKRIEIPLGVAAVVIFYLFVEYLFNLPTVFEGSTSYLKNLGVIISAFAIILAALNIFVIHGKNILQQGKGWLYDVYFMILFVAMLVVGIPLGTTQPNYGWIMQNVYGPTANSTWAIMSLYYVSALYFVWRIRNIESLVLLVAGLTTWLNNAPITAVWFPPMLTVSRWVQDVPNIAGLWGSELAVGIGMVGIAVRVMLLLERRFIAGGSS